MSQREHAHQLIDQLRAAHLLALVGLLETIIDPVTAALRNAPLDDEPVTETGGPKGTGRRGQTESTGSFSRPIQQTAPSPSPKLLSCRQMGRDLGSEGADNSVRSQKVTRLLPPGLVARSSITSIPFENALLTSISLKGTELSAAFALFFNLSILSAPFGSFGSLISILRFLRLRSSKSSDGALWPLVAEGVACEPSQPTPYAKFPVYYERWRYPVKTTPPPECS